MGDGSYILSHFSGPLNEDHKKALNGIKERAINKQDGSIDIGKVKEEILTFATGNVNDKIDTVEEDQFISALFNGTTDDEALKDVQKKLNSVLNKLIESNFLDRNQQINSKINELAKDGNKNVVVRPLDQDQVKKFGLTKPLTSDDYNGIQKARLEARTKNKGQNLSLFGKTHLNEAEKAISKVDNNFGMEDGNKRNLRKMLHNFWTNDGGNTRFLSIEEMNAIRIWGEKNYTDKNEFYKDFQEMFIKSVDEDTPFSISLMANQWADLSGTCNFGGGFSDFFNNLRDGIFNHMIATGQYKDGDTLAFFHGVKDGFDNVLVTFQDGKAVFGRTMSEHGDKNKIKYASEDDKEAPKDKTPANAGTTLGNAATSDKKKALAAKLNRIKNNNKVKNYINKYPNLKNFNGLAGLDTQKLDNLKGELGQISSNKEIGLDANEKNEIGDIVKGLQELITEESRSKPPAAQGSTQTTPTAKFTAEEIKALNQDIYKLKTNTLVSRYANYTRPTFEDFKTDSNIEKFDPNNLNKLKEELINIRERGQFGAEENQLLDKVIKNLTAYIKQKGTTK